MKRFLAILSSVLTLASCERAVDGVSACGTLSFNLVQDISVADATKSEIGDHFTPPGKDDYLITLTNYAGATAWKGRLSEWDPDLRLTEGEYTLSAVYGTAGEEGPGKPYMSGSVQLEIKSMECSEATVVTRLSNCILKIRTGEMFRNYFREYGFSIETGSGNKFDLQEGESAFAEPFRFTLNGNFITREGKTVTLSEEYSDLQACTAYTITVDVSNVGGMGITITFNDDVETIKIEEELN